MELKEALECVRHAMQLPEDGSHFSAERQAIAMLSALVDRAGEPVAEPMYGAMIEADFERNAVTFEMRGEYVCAAGLYEIRPHVPPAQPGVITFAYGVK